MANDSIDKIRIQAKLLKSKYLHKFYELISFDDEDKLDYELKMCCGEILADKSLPNIKQMWACSREVDKILFDAYHQIHLRKVKITKDMQNYLYRRFVESKFGSESEYFGSSLAPENSLDTNLYNEFNRMKIEVCDKITELSQFHDSKQMNNCFIFGCNFLALKLNAVKKVYRRCLTEKKCCSIGLTERFPWEQLQFILSIYVKSYQNIDEENSGLYLCVLTQSTLMKHLNNFLNHLKPFDIENELDKYSVGLLKLEKITVTVTMPDHLETQSSDLNKNVNTNSGDASQSQKMKKKSQRVNKGPKSSNINSPDLNDVKMKHPISKVSEGLDANADTNSGESSLTQIMKKKSRRINKGSKSKVVNFNKLEENTEIKPHASHVNTIGSNYPNLEKDFWLVKNIYSLKIINNHIDTIVDDLPLYVGEESHEIQCLAVVRSLLLIGEFSKCSPESPHLSPKLKQLVSMSCDIQHYLKKIRNEYSHVSDITLNKNKTSKFNLGDNLDQIRLDLKKVETCFKFLLYQESYTAIECFTKRCLSCKTLNDFLLCYPEYVLNAILSCCEALAGKLKAFNPVVLIENSLKYLKVMAGNLEKSLIDRLCHLVKCWSYYKEDRPISNGDLLYLLASHLKYFQFIKVGQCSSGNYESFKQILAVLVTNIKMENVVTFEEQQAFEETLYKLITTTDKSQIKTTASNLFRFISKDMKDAKGIKMLKHNFGTTSLDPSVDYSFYENKSEVDDLLERVRIQLNNNKHNYEKMKKCLIFFLEKLKKELDMYRWMIAIRDIFKKLENIKKNEDVFLTESTIREAINSVCNDENDTIFTEINRFLTRHKNCPIEAKKEFEKQNKSKYEALIGSIVAETELNYCKTKTGFINQSLKTKARLISDFFRSEDDDDLIKSYVKTITSIAVQEYLTDFYHQFKIMSVISSSLDDFEESNDNLILSKLKSALKMIVLQLLETAHNYGDGDKKKALITLRPDVVLHCGKSMRNFLAHCDIIYDLLVFDTDVLLPIIAVVISEKLSKENILTWIPLQNYFMRNETSDFDWPSEEAYFCETNYNIVKLQDNMFEAVKKDDIVELEYCLSNGADPRGFDQYRRNALQLAFDCESVKCFNILVDRYSEIILCKIEEEPSEYVMTLDVSHVSRVIKFIRMLLTFSCFQDNSNVSSTINNLISFIESKFQAEREPIVPQLHLLVYFRDMDLINKYLMSESSELGSILDINQNTALDWAAVLGYCDICQILTDLHLLNNEEDYLVGSALNHAVKELRWDIVHYLMSIKRDKFSPYHDPFLISILVGDVKTNQLFTTHPFMGGDNTFNVTYFGYSLCFAEKAVIKQLLFYLDSLTESKVADFIFDQSTRAVDANLLRKIAYNIILSIACFLGRKTIVELILLKYKDFIDLSEQLNYSDEEIIFLRQVLNSMKTLEAFTVKSMLYWACSSKNENNAEITKLLLDKGFDINTLVKGFSPLHVALLEKNTEVCRVLINGKADLELLTPTKLSPLHISCMYRLDDITEKLLDANINLFVLTGQSLRSGLHLAAVCGHYSTVQLLLRNRNEIQSHNGKKLIELEDINGLTALHLAFLHGDKDVVEFLLQYCDVVKKSINKLNYVHTAVLGNNEINLKLLISKIPYNERNLLINSFTTFSELSNEKELFKALNFSFWTLENKSDLKNTVASFNIQSPLFCAESKKSIEILLKNGAEINLQNSFGRTALHEAVIKGNYGAFACLLQQSNCIADTVDCHGFTPLTSAVCAGLFEFTKLLIKKGKPDVNKIIPKTFWSLFLSKEDVALSGTDVEPLLKRPSDTLSDEVSITPIIIAASQGFTLITKLLIENDASINRNVWFNPLSLAIQNNHFETVALLLEAYSLKEVSDSKLPYLHLAIAMNNTKALSVLLSKGISPNLQFNEITAYGFACALKNQECLTIIGKHYLDFCYEKGTISFLPVCGIFAEPSRPSKPFIHKPKTREDNSTVAYNAYAPLHKDWIMNPVQPKKDL